MRMFQTRDTFPFLRTIWVAALTTLCLSAGMSLAQADDVLLSPEYFLAQGFGTAKPQSKILLMTPALHDQALQVLGHDYAGMRVRYWWLDGKSAWILDEIGKEKPITIGVMVKDDTIEAVNVLVYREERGGEVQHSSFVRQFMQLKLDENNHLNTVVDGISGATLSVNAVQSVARLALVFHRVVRAKNS